MASSALLCALACPALALNAGSLSRAAVPAPARARRLVAVESWYDSGVRLTGEPAAASPPAAAPAPKKEREYDMSWIVAAGGDPEKYFPEYFEEMRAQQAAAEAEGAVSSGLDVGSSLLPLAGALAFGWFAGPLLKGVTDGIGGAIGSVAGKGA